MGFFDDMQSALKSATDGANRMVAGAGIAGNTAKVKLQAAECTRRRKEALAKLGEELYALTRSEPAWREGREALYDAVDKLDEELAGYNKQLQELGERIDEVIPQSTPAAPSNMPEAVPVDQIGSATCPSCGAPVTPGDKFCMCCGKPLSWDDDQQG